MNVIFNLISHFIKLKNTSIVSYDSKTTVMFWPFDPAKNAIQGDAPEGGDTF